MTRDSHSRTPLVSCLMVTSGRQQWAVHAADMFLRQDYPNLELVVVESGHPALEGQLPPDRRIRLVHLPGRQSIGALRNHSCRLARGAVAVLWDDDDWYARDRVSRQVKPILDGRADVTGLVGFPWLELEGWRAWRIAPQAQDRLLFQGIGCGTLAFGTSLCTGRVKFADRSLAEDVAFLQQALAAGARLERVTAGDCYVYVRHGRNTWRVEPGRFRGSESWVRCAIPDLPAPDLEFLRSRRRPALGTLVSCLMPTADRRQFVSQALLYYQRQDHPDRELVVVDDGSDPVADLVDGIPGVHYHRLQRRMVLGAKRNLAVELAQGDVLAHWDDDDWYSPDRITTQLARMAETGAEVSGVSTLPFYAPATGAAWTYRWPAHRRPWVAGTSLVFTRGTWERNRFATAAVGEDTRFVWRAPADRVVAVPERVVVGITHAGNTVPKTGRGGYWSATPAADVEDLLGEDLTFYRSRLITTTRLDPR